MSSVPEVEVYLGISSSEPALVGTLRPSFAGGRNLASASFEYHPSYLRSSQSFAVSPDLPLFAGRTYTEENTNIFGAFSDAAPDQWGRKIIEANHTRQLERNPELSHEIGDFDFLLGVSDYTRMGALRFKRPGTREWLSNDSAVANVHDLEKVIAAARRYEANEATDEDVAYLLDIATSPGGARPKANVVTEAGQLAIAKLPHSKDHTVDVECWEALALTLARNSGLRTPSFATYPASEHKTVLITERFDRGEDGRRLAYMSVATAMGIGAHEDSRGTYEDLADVIAETSFKPNDDLLEMFTRVALTVLINNVDDHWRNHGFLRGCDGWRLAPVFDINPSARRGVISSRPINSRDDPRHRDVRHLLDVADAYHLTEEQAASIIRRVADQVERWPDIATSLGLSKAQQDEMSGAFSTEQLRRAHEIAPAVADAAAPQALSSTGAVWVHPHVRNGNNVAGYWRAARSSDSGS